VEFVQSERIASNPHERHEEKAKLRKGKGKGEKRIPAERAVLEATVANSRKSRQKGREEIIER